MPLRFLLFAFLLSVTTAQAAKLVRDDVFGAIRGLKAEATAPAAFGGEFEPRRGENWILIGGTNVVEMQFDNSFEALATLSWPEKGLKFRNLAWQADTAYRQQRPLYFYDDEFSDKAKGSTPDEREKVEAGTVFVRFGKMESLDGLGKKADFLTAYAGFLERLKQVTPRVVLVTPTPFFETGPAVALAKERNEVLAQYVDGIQKLASEHELLVIDLFGAIPANAELSTNGVHLSESGQLAVSKAMIEQLGGQVQAGALASAETKKLQETITEKNFLWLQYYRPTNWAFLYGDRQNVPSSRDHVDGEKRWFPFELEKALSMVGELEAEIHSQAKAVTTQP